MKPGRLSWCCRMNEATDWVLRSHRRTRVSTVRLLSGLAGRSRPVSVMTNEVAARAKSTAKNVKSSMVQQSCDIKRRAYDSEILWMRNGKTAGQSMQAEIGSAEPMIGSASGKILRRARRIRETRRNMSRFVTVSLAMKMTTFGPSATSHSCTVSCRTTSNNSSLLRPWIKRGAVAFV